VTRRHIAFLDRIAGDFSGRFLWKISLEDFSGRFLWKISLEEFSGRILSYV
jgi:phage FluMu protein gp41